MWCHDMMVMWEPWHVEMAGLAKSSNPILLFIFLTFRSLTPIGWTGVQKQTILVMPDCQGERPFSRCREEVEKAGTEPMKASLALSRCPWKYTWHIMTRGIWGHRSLWIRLDNGLGSMNPVNSSCMLCKLGLVYQFSIYHHPSSPFTKIVTKIWAICFQEVRNLNMHITNEFFIFIL